ncbi:hypothetical protein Ciccas_000955 [Cichlidogyrus casuarinus]|uniref:Uncharacterized protein n=1 Tax=Cichlidogyrus casuarinus TaxID=1844966 RepID=A0ABD2QLF1_9PLAT
MVLQQGLGNDFLLLMKENQQLKTEIKAMQAREHSWQMLWQSLQKYVPPDVLEQTQITNGGAPAPSDSPVQTWIPVSNAQMLPPFVQVPAGFVYNGTTHTPDDSKK